MKAYPLVYIVLDPKSLICGVYDTEDKARQRIDKLHKLVKPEQRKDECFIMIEEIH